MHINAIFTLVSAAFGLIVLIAAAVAVARASFARAQIEALRGDRDDLIKRVEILEEDNDRKTQLLSQESEKVRVLTQLVTGKEQLDELALTMQRHEKDALERHREMGRLVGQVKDLLKENKTWFAEQFNLITLSTTMRDERL